MAKEPSSVGERELELLRWLERAGDATVGEAAEGFGDPAGLARSTVLTMMERLRKKRLLERRPVDGIYRYRLALPSGEIARHAVAAFVEGTLGGSLAPFVAYLAESERLSERQAKELESLLERRDDERDERQERQEKARRAR